MTHQCFGFLDVFEAEQELAVEITQIDCVEVDDMDFAESGEQEVLQQFASDATSTHEKHARLKNKLREIVSMVMRQLSF